MSADVAKFKALMGDEDPTSKFVGLFLLLRLLNEAPQYAVELWDTIDPAFLDRLILAKKTKSASAEEANDLSSTGCAILHAFARFPQVVATSKYLKRADVLMKLYTRG